MRLMLMESPSQFATKAIDRRMTRLGRFWASFLYVIDIIALAAQGMVMAGYFRDKPYVTQIAGAVALMTIAWSILRHFSLQEEYRLLSEDRQRLDRTAHSDPLTGLMNRIAFNNVLAALALPPGRDIAILYFDLDHFKEINDRFGHKYGDMMLVESARRLKRIMPHAIALARIGGDEFAAVIEARGPVSAEDYARQTVAALSEPLVIDEHRLNVGTSIGIAYGNLMTDAADRLLKHADLAMYEAKANERNNFRVYGDDISTRLSRRSTIRTELQKCLNGGSGFHMLYQPMVNARTGDLVCAEALLRWRSVELGDVPPGIVIPIAEESGQIIDLTDCTLDAAIAAIQELDHVPVAVNISPIYFSNPIFARVVGDKLAAANVNPDLLRVEVTEGVLISQMARAQRTIGELREIGVQIILDDFGIGYSSLSYLQNLEFDGFKIDKSFLRDLGNRAQAVQVMRAVIDLGRSLHMEVAVEGIEADWQARLVQLLNADVLQGYFIAYPLSLEEIKPFHFNASQTLRFDRAALPKED